MAGTGTSGGGKAAVRLAIQKEVFTPAEERLLGLAAVSKPGRKKKVSHLCVSGKQGSPLLLALHCLFFFQSQSSRKTAKGIRESNKTGRAEERQTNI